MNENKVHQVAQAVSKAVEGIAGKFNLSSSAIQAKLASNCLLIKIDLAQLSGQAQPTENAIKRYKAHAGQLGLPKLGTMLMVAGKEYALVGLSSDGGRVKVRQNSPAAAVIDLPLVTIKSALEMDGAKKVAALEAAEAAAPSDVIDPSTTSLLACIGKKEAPKPATGQK